MRVFSQINNCQQKQNKKQKQNKTKQNKKKQKTDKTKRGAPLLGLAKSVYYFYLLRMVYTGMHYSPNITHRVVISDDTSVIREHAFDVS